METWWGGRGPKGALKVALVAFLAIVGLLVLYALVGALERALDRLSGSLQLFILVTAGVLAWTSRRYLARDRLRREAEEHAASVVDIEPVIARALPVPEVRAVPVPGNRALWEGPPLLERGFDEGASPREEPAERRPAPAAPDEMVRALEEVAHACAVLSEHLDGNRRQNRALRESILRLALAPSSSGRPSVPAPRHAVAESAVVSNEPEISLVELEAEEAESHHGTAAIEERSEILCRHDNAWVGGVEIIEVTRDDHDDVRYWLRRTSDGYIFPRAFEEDDIRFATEPVLSGQATGGS